MNASIISWIFFIFSNLPKYKILKDFLYGFLIIGISTILTSDADTAKPFKFHKLSLGSAYAMNKGNATEKLYKRTMLNKFIGVGNQILFCKERF